MKPRNRLAVARALAAALALAALQAPPSARAEKADKDKPTEIESNRMMSDEARRMSIFEGSVVLTKGTLVVHADRLVVRQDADGFQHVTATGDPVRFRQKADARDGKPGAWIEGEAKRVEIDERADKVELFDDARVSRDKDVVRGNYISLDQRSGFYSVTGGADAPQGRVRAVLQPKNEPSAAAPGASPAPAAK
ncbi:MAG TPA: lipopolysaccharide transport periplasmic protein LptA [Burkholderiales bacterium]|nr:lipopolysaccharide transport periplasmic protein LptA [Burkholderiales bacterium]